MPATDFSINQSRAMNLLVTAGATFVPIDRVRGITTTFTGRTGAALARAAHGRGHRVTLLTSHPETAAGTAASSVPADSRWTVQSYRTFDDLHQAMGLALCSREFDGVIHSAAVSDYRAAGVFAPGSGTDLLASDGTLRSMGPMTFIDRSAAKIKSDQPELWLRLVRTPKLIDLIRSAWNFTGFVVKFKLEVDVNDAQLLDIAERSRVQSQADLMVANTLDGATAYAYLGPLDGHYERIPREELADRVIDAVERRQRERVHG